MATVKHFYFLCAFYAFATKIIAAYFYALGFDCWLAECTAAFGKRIGSVVAAPLIDNKPHALKSGLDAYEEDAIDAQIQLSSEWRWNGLSVSRWQRQIILIK